ncbi:MAG: chitobiase/beta-hexosaminidase C-terminal domain-containing protein, partial [Bacteroidaceae bacterium]|nr:chitobiase/beta-hexosaminidase C-terminal domain-containing protein [Bacteroidaceae bacterium]
MVRKKTILSALIVVVTAPLLAQPKFSKPHGVYKNRFTLKITKSDANAVIRFTTDGSEPSADCKLFCSSSTIVQSTTILRAAEFKNNERTSLIGTVSYIFPD